METSRSNAIYQRAVQIMPGGVNSPVRAFKSVGREPIFIQRGEGSVLTDLDENTYIDYIGSWGPAILGHGHPVVTEGVAELLGFGTGYGLPTQIEVQMAEMLVDAMPSMEMVRMVCSGTEATMSALRLARGFTGRQKIVKFEGCYHGHSDGLLVKSGSGTLTYGVPTSAGVSEAIAKDTIVLEYNNLEQVKKAFEEQPDDIACVIIEPVPANMGVVKPEVDFLSGLRSLTTRYGALLIFDEVITGFRLGYHGAQGYFNITPDLTCLGKIIGGGMPVGAYGGRSDIMSYVSPSGPVYQAGTLAGNPIAMKTGLNLLTYLKNHQHLYKELEEKAIFLEKGFLKNFEELGIEGTVNRVGSLLSPFLGVNKVDGYAHVLQADNSLYASYFNAMLEQGIMLPPAQFEAMFLSQAHTQTQLEYTLEAHYKALRK